ncbi:MAG: hypothetical protein ACRBF0_01200 [Calditrichia bacterium]
MIAAKESTPRHEQLKGLSHECLEGIVVALPSAVVVLSTRGIIQYINPTGKKLLGKEVGQRLSPEFGNVIQNLKTTAGLNAIISDKRMHSFDAHLAPFFWNGEKAQLLTLHDITSLKGEEAAARERELLKNIQQLAGAIAHEFSQPLQILGHLLEIIEMDGLSKGRLAKCKKMVFRITGLVRNMRNMITLKKQPYLDDEIIDLPASALADIMSKRLKLNSTPTA